MLEQLQAIGLTRNESLVYDMLVQHGPCKAGLLITKLDIHRNAIYEALDALVRKGFATKIKARGVWLFQITEPDSLLTALKRKEQLTNEVIGEIKLLRQQTDQQITVYEGVDSFRAYWISSLERFPEGTIDYTVGVPFHDLWEKALGPKVLQQYMDLRVKKKIVWKTIHFEITDTERELLKKYPDLTEYRVWPKKFSLMGNFNVVHDTVILQTLNHLPRIIEIRDKDLVEVFKGYFDAMWEQAMPVKAK